MLIFECSYSDLVAGDLDKIFAKKFFDEGHITIPAIIGPGQYDDSTGDYPLHRLTGYKNRWQEPLTNVPDYLHSSPANTVPIPISFTHRAHVYQQPPMVLVTLNNMVASGRRFWIMDVLMVAQERGEVDYQSVADALTPVMESYAVSDKIKAIVPFGDDDLLFAVRWQAVCYYEYANANTFFSQLDVDHLFLGYIIDARTLGAPELIVEVEIGDDGMHELGAPLVRGDLLNMQMDPADVGAKTSLITNITQWGDGWCYTYRNIYDVLCPLVIGWGVDGNTIDIGVSYSDYPCDGSAPEPVPDPFIDELKLALLAAGGITALVAALQTFKKLKGLIHNEDYIPGV